MSLIQWAHFPPLGDDRGSLVALEAEKKPYPLKSSVCITFLVHSKAWHAGFMRTST